MAKWGEGDPRWIVEERPDAHNVNNWHWSEKDATEWSKKEIKRLLVDVSVCDDNIGAAYVTDIVSCEGEATINNRKKKIICFYEFEVRASWNGSMTGSNTVYEGELFIPNLSEEQSPEDLDIQISFKKDQQPCRELKELMRLKGSEKIRNKLSVFAENLRRDCAATLQVPTKDSTKASNGNKGKNVASNFKQQLNAVPSTPAAPTSAVGAKIHTQKLVMTVQFKTNAVELYKTLVEQPRISAWSRSDVKSNAQVNQEFAFFGGNVTGTYTQMEENSKIVMRWRQKTWPAAHYSTATLTFTQNEDGTELKLEQTGVPENSIEATKSGWHQYYWNPIKHTFGFGTDLVGVF